MIHHTYIKKIRTKSLKNLRELFRHSFNSKYEIVINQNRD